METQKNSPATTIDLISHMVDTLHPTLRKEGTVHLEALHRLFRLSEERYAQGAYWKYVVVEPRPFRYALRAVERTDHGWIISLTESKPFTSDHHIAEAAADLFTRDSLPPAHLAKAIDEYMNSL